MIALKLPASQSDFSPTRRVIPGPVISARRGKGRWIGRGRIEVTQKLRSISTSVAETGPLWTTVEVLYTFAGDYVYRARLMLRPEDEACEVQEESTLPVRLWPAPRPYREIGTLGTSFWDQLAEDIANPCTRPCPISNFIFDVRSGFEPDRMITHSTSSWEIMDMPLASPTLKTYTAMRAANPFIDGGWMGVYDSTQDEMLGIASIDVTHWRVPDDTIHPAHRTPGASAEVLLVNSREDGCHFRFPIENLTRRWLLTVFSRKSARGLGMGKPPKCKPVRLDPDFESPLWTLRTRRGDLRLDKMKDWILDWPATEDAHPRVLCKSSDFAQVRDRVESVPELRATYEHTKHLRPADRYIMTGEASGLDAVEAITHAKELVQNVLDRGYAGPIYAIGLARPVRRYVLACDILWDCFTPKEKREARRVCALAAYILTDGDWWQYAYRPGETTYLPNFNVDVFCCAGLIGLFLSDHPCSSAWIDYCVERMDIELKNHLRLDGGGEENMGGYLMSTWTQLYMPALWALRHCGIRDYSTDENILAGGKFLLKIIGPPDPRDNGTRMMPPIGHHPNARKCFPFLSWLASFVKDSDPVLSSNLMWAWRESGSPVGNLYDHSGPTANPLTRHYIFHNPAIKETVPDLGSHTLPYVGAVLRTHGHTDEGSYLVLKAGRVHSHHDDDEGSFHYFGRGIPLALDGLPLRNGAPVEEHNVVSFLRYGQPTGIVEHFTTTPAADYVRARIAPRGFCCDPMYIDNTHRSGFVRELLLVKSREPGGIEYLVVKDSVTGPDACQWNLDVLSKKPSIESEGRVHFHGHPQFDMGLEVITLEPHKPKILIEQGTVNELLNTKKGRAQLPEGHVNWPVVEHWLMHLPAPPGTTFVVVLFPRRRDESSPTIHYLDREETISVTHDDGSDLIFLRPNPMVGVSLSGITFRGRAGIVQERVGERIVQPLDADRMSLTQDGETLAHVL
ncbi:MAG: hypothetical protein CO095_14245 [Armatimonadetes bacterium CG_4_9_14_3_um_filter_58_7]|nr:MAG: hypothetical protein CO095_14245 [Armatimonadetes bacterium CG_4_9_14_3_um_filter_58_7]